MAPADAHRTLIVDDDPLFLRLLQRALRGVGRQVVATGSCAAARSLSGKFDLAVLDLDLGDGTGVDLAEDLLAGERVERIVFFSATRDRRMMGRAARIGTVIEKRGNLHALLEELARPEPSVPSRSGTHEAQAAPTRKRAAR